MKNNKNKSNYFIYTYNNSLFLVPITNKSLLLEGSNRLQVIEVTSCSISINSINSPSDPLKYGEYLYILPPGETNTIERLTPSTLCISISYILFVDIYCWYSTI